MYLSVAGPDADVDVDAGVGVDADVDVDVDVFVCVYIYICIYIYVHAHVYVCACSSSIKTCLCFVIQLCVEPQSPAFLHGTSGGLGHLELGHEPSHAPSVPTPLRIRMRLLTYTRAT